MTRPSRDALAVVLAILAAVATIGAVVAVYLRFEVADSEAFADRATAALDEPAVRRVAARQVVVSLIDRGSTDLVGARPLLESVVEAIVGTPPFRRLVRLAAVETHRVLFEREQTSLVFDLADVSTVVLSGLRSVSPDVAKEVPTGVDARLLDLRERQFAGDTLNAADEVRRWSVIAPVLAAVLLALALASAYDRRATLTRFGLALGVLGTICVVALATARTLVTRSVEGTEEIPVADLQSAAGGIWDAFLGDLRSLILIVALVGFVLASSILTAEDPAAVRQRLQRLARRPDSRPALGVRGVALVAVGFLVLLSPDLAVRAAAYVAGAALVYVGSAQLLAALSRTRREEPGTTRRRVLAVAGVAVLTAAVASVAAGAVLNRGVEVSAAAAPSTGCNGARALCSRRISEVLFPGTHNSMSAADVPGWSLTNQRRSVGRQLDDGIRLFLIDPHYGRELEGGRVQTDFAGEARDSNKVARELSPEALAAFDRLGPSLGRGESARGPRDVWLCHTVCELGATRMTETLTTMRKFLERNRGAVLVLFLESYVKEQDLADTFRDTGTARYAATLDRAEPLPTLGQLVRSGKRLMLFTEKTPTAGIPWLSDGFSFVQDTPLGARKPSEQSCAPSRGDEDSPILMINHWIDRFPPPLRANRSILTRRFLLNRIRRCEKERQMPVAFVAVDYYDQGEIVSVAEELNRR